MLIIVLAIAAVALTGIGTASAQHIVADHSSCTEFEEIPASVIENITAGYRVYYGRTSHGGQVVSGLDYLVAENSLYALPDLREVSDDLGYDGDTSWVADMRDWLDSHTDYNVAMMAWCGGVSENTDAGIDIYLNKMTELEGDYPGVYFIYMTGHLDGGGPDGLLYHNNNRIRDYCAANGKILFDFADIESYDPDGVYYPNETDACNWCYDWCDSYSCCGGYCAHSHCFSCYQKGRAWWTMMAEIDGWSLSLDVEDDRVDGLPHTPRLEQNYPNPFNPSTAIEFDLARGGQVRLEVFDLLGRSVAVLADGRLSAGHHRVQWQPTDQPSGVYFYRLRTGESEQTRKMLLLR